MLRGVLGVVLVVGLVVVSVFGPQWFESVQGDGRSDVDTAASCYPMKEVCRWQLARGEGNAEASLTMMSADGEQLTLTASLPGEDGPVMILLNGETMYMGEYPLRLEKAGQPGQYRVTFVPPFCSTGDDMVWRITVRTGAAPVEMPFRVLFRHR